MKRIMITTKDGKMFIGNDAAELVDKIRRNSAFTMMLTNQEYMELTSKRSMRFNDQPLRFDNETNFIDDLINVGSIKKVEL